MRAAFSKHATKTASVILIPKHLRMDWMDVMVLDVDLAPASLKVAGAIGTHFDNKSGMTYVSQKTLARVTGLSDATVKRAVADLERRGYILIQRREIGERTDGRKVYGGKGVANVYLPAVNAAQISATDRGQKLAAIAEKSWAEIQNKTASKQVTHDLLYDPQSRSNTSGKQVMGDLPTLSSPSEKISTRARGPSCPDGLGPAGALLQQRLGADVYASWFSKIDLVDVSPEAVTLSVATRFQASRIRQDFETSILEAWQAITPSIRRVIITVRKEAAA
ncbi:DnaA N-terminal domain-containing protein [Tardiphaga sp. 11_C7_N12_6]|uniref:DnaA N-terminal domain-containing protein n=1 Tax=Tardiphaga sp. 11_C7_N12_6 TaxID=3240789 RepID=UPI003F28DC58